MKHKNGLLKDVNKLLDTIDNKQHRLSEITKIETVEKIEGILKKANAMKKPNMKVIGQLEGYKDNFIKNASPAVCEDLKKCLRKMRDSIH